MHYSRMLTAALATGLSMASPIAIEKRTGYAVDDFLILNYALTLEYLERKFYQEGLANYTQADFVAAGFPDPFYTNLQEIAADEKVHVDFIAGAITAAGGKPVNEATYSFPSTDPKSFVALSSALEGVGVSAYLGAAASIVEKDYLTAAGSILSVEARHSSYIRAALSSSPFPLAFDTPLGFTEVFSLAAAFITGFAPEDPPLPFKAFPTLTPAPIPAYYVAGKTPITFPGAKTAFPSDAPLYVAFFSGLKPYILPVTITGEDYSVVIPEGIAGQVYVVLTNHATSATDETIIAGPAIIEAYPDGKTPAAPAPARA
ncbi:MAG: hypothetical protein M1825_006178 [Sarcosagium campestre]|nr:MAG: hypothetical protein M1825_006178 [Sarcosagium campestre]